MHFSDILLLLPNLFQKHLIHLLHQGIELRYPPRIAHPVPPESPEIEYLPLYLLPNLV